MLYFVKFEFMKNWILFGVMTLLSFYGQAQQKLSFEYEGDDLYQFVGKDLNSPYAGALIAQNPIMAAQRFDQVDRELADVETSLRAARERKDLRGT